jgi:hypothetical protein
MTSTPRRSSTCSSGGWGAGGRWEAGLCACVAEAAGGRRGRFARAEGLSWSCSARAAAAAAAQAAHRPRLPRLILPRRAGAFGPHRAFRSHFGNAHYAQRRPGAPPPGSRNADAQQRGALLGLLQVRARRQRARGRGRGPRQGGSAGEAVAASSPRALLHPYPPSPPPACARAPAGLHDPLQRLPRARVRAAGGRGARPPACPLVRPPARLACWGAAGRGAEGPRAPRPSPRPDCACPCRRAPPAPRTPTRTPRWPPAAPPTPPNRNPQRDGKYAQPLETARLQVPFFVKSVADFESRYGAAGTHARAVVERQVRG